MRAEYNNVMNVYSNDGNYGPDTLLFTTDCRIVFYDRISIESTFINQVEAYVTYVGGILSAGSVTFAGGVFTIDTTTAWVVEFSSDPGIFFFVRWCERIAPLVGPPYRRAHLQAS